jgi:poly-gamma-glutamate capsule biosynthesis protein CapA/YwtB (metallophosphatase superfamily)
MKSLVTKYASLMRSWKGRRFPSHGHSSHHTKAIEIYRSRLILYGCGDFLNDYEGIGGYEEFRDDLALMYFPDMDPTSAVLVAL